MVLNELDELSNQFIFKNLSFSYNFKIIKSRLEYVIKIEGLYIFENCFDVFLGINKIGLKE